MRAPLKVVQSDARAAAVRMAYDPAAFSGGGPAAVLQEQFPQVNFGSLGGAWRTGTLGAAHALIAHVDGANRQAVDALCVQLLESGVADRVIVCVANADLPTTRGLMRAGVADVLAEPVNDLAFAASLDRMLAKLESGGPDPGLAGRVVAFLKAGGGAGSTALAVQAAAILAHSSRGLKVCVVDLDIQFGQAALYLDVQDSISMAQVLSAGGDLGEMAFASALTPHASGARVLAAPPEFMPLETLTTGSVDALLAALRRDFDLVILDMPAAWTAWTYRALRQSDHIVLVSQLSVPHAHLAKRQLQLLQTQRLDDIPLTMVCNRAGGDNPAGVSLRSVENAIGRHFDVVAPEERKLMNEAINQGVAISTIRRGSKLEKAIEQLADLIIPARAAKRAKRGK
jgi:pilus assembly protein CpaE